MDSEHIKLLFVTKTTNVIENVMPADFIHQLKEIMTGEEDPGEESKHTIATN